jgi:hypothetical protein
MTLTLRPADRPLFCPGVWVSDAAPGGLRQRWLVAARRRPGRREYLGRVVPASYHDFFSACATTAGALIGLLFVAISIFPAKLTGRSAEADHQVKAATAFSALVNTLVISLVALLPGASLSVTAIIVAASGLSSTVALIIVLFRDSRMRVRWDRLFLPVTLLVLYGLQLAIGVQLGPSPRNLGLISSLGGLCVGCFGFAIARAWALVGARSSSLLATVVEMARQPGDPDSTAEHSGTAEDGGGTAEHSGTAEDSGTAAEAAVPPGQEDPG